MLPTHLFGGAPIRYFEIVFQFYIYFIIIFKDIFDVIFLKYKNNEN